VYVTMADKLISSVPGAEIETKTEAKILLEFIKNNWALVDTAASTVDFGAHPSRTKKAITINCYRIYSNMYKESVGGQVYGFSVPVAIDVYVRDIRAEGLRDEPAPKLVTIDNYLREFILVNRLSLRNKGVNNITIERIEYPDEPAPTAGSEAQRVWYHLVVTARMYYNMFRVPV
jgi:hypothetical protein